MLTWLVVKDAFTNSPQTRRWSALRGEIIHGRRINDEVELFDEGSGEVGDEPPGFAHEWWLLTNVLGVAWPKGVT